MHQKTTLTFHKNQGAYEHPDEYEESDAEKFSMAPYLRNAQQILSSPKNGLALTPAEVEEIANGPTVVLDFGTNGTALRLLDDTGALLVRRR